MPASTPPRRSWFSVWRWKRWKLAIVTLLLLLMTYCLSAIPMVRLARQRAPQCQQIAYAVFAPVLFSRDHFKLVKWTTDWENHMMDQVIDPDLMIIVIKGCGTHEDYEMPEETQLSDPPADALDVQNRSTEPAP